MLKSPDSILCQFHFNFLPFRYRPQRALADAVKVMATEWADTIAQDYFIFLDESGNYDFSPKGTSHLVYTAISSGQVRAGIEEIHALKHWLIACGQELEYFHATEDFQIVRDEVSKVICALPIRVDTIVVEKRKAGPSIRPIERLYPKMFEILLRYLLKGLPRQPDRIQIFCDTPDNKKSKRAVEKGIKLALAPLASSVAYSVLLHASKSHPYLQVADYCGWAIYRKWEGQDYRSYKLIMHMVKNEFDVFQRGIQRWY